MQMTTKLWFYILLIFNAAILTYAVVLFYRHFRQRAEAIHTIPTRIFYKMFLCLCLGAGLVLNLPYSLLFFGVVISCSLVPFITDILVKEKGIFFVSRLIPWQEIEKISDHYIYLIIGTTGTFGRRAFLKLIWKIGQPDIELLKAKLEK
jgi:hypothetical protein